MEPQTPAESLSGVHLDGGWQVMERFEKKPYSTGSHFSVGYRVVRDGVDAYLKALDITEAVNQDDWMQGLEEFSRDYNFERRINDHCSGLDRVVACIDHGYHDTKLGDPRFSRVPYLIFEKANGDVRRHLASRKVTLAWRFRALHHISTGMLQLHGRTVLHQDLKPSNVMVFPEVSKVGDLGRASCGAVSSRFDTEVFAGDRGYAPPEVLYRTPLEDAHLQRRATDTFMLGSMVFFMLSGATLQGRLLSPLPPELLPRNRAVKFPEVLPLLQATFASCLSEIEVVAGPLGPRTVLLLRALGEPDPQRRGHQRDRNFAGNQYAFNRFVSELDLLARRAQEFRL